MSRRGALTRLVGLGAAVALVLGVTGCMTMSADVHRQDPSLPKVAEGKPGSENWVNEDLLRKGWKEGDSGWEESKQGPTTAYSKDQGYVIPLRGRKVETWRHQRDLISDMIWAREKLKD